MKLALTEGISCSNGNFTCCHLSNQMHQQYKCSTQSLSLRIYTPSFRYPCSLVSPKIQKISCQVQSVFILKWTFILWKMMCFDNGNQAIHLFCPLLFIKLTYPLYFLFSGLLNPGIKNITWYKLSNALLSSFQTSVTSVAVRIWIDWGIV